MDLLQDYITPYLPLPLRLLLSSTRSTSTNTYLTHLTPLLRRYLTTYLPTPLLALLSPLLNLLSQFTSLLPNLVSGAPPTDLNFTTLAVLVVLLVVGLKTLNMLRRMLFYWVGMTVRLGLWAVVGLGALWVWNRGLEGSVEDLVGLVGGLEGGAGRGDGARMGPGGGADGRRGAMWEREMGRGRGGWR